MKYISDHSLLDHQCFLLVAKTVIFSKVCHLVFFIHVYHHAHDVSLLLLFTLKVQPDANQFFSLNIFQIYLWRKSQRVTAPCETQCTHIGQWVLTGHWFFVWGFAHDMWLYWNNIPYKHDFFLPHCIQPNYVGTLHFITPVVYNMYIWFPNRDKINESVFVLFCFVFQKEIHKVIRTCVNFKALKVGTYPLWVLYIK